MATWQARVAATAVARVLGTKQRARSRTRDAAPGRRDRSAAAKRLDRSEQHGQWRRLHALHKRARGLPKARGPGSGGAEGPGVRIARGGNDAGWPSRATRKRWTSPAGPRPRSSSGPLPRRRCRPGARVHGYIPPALREARSATTGHDLLRACLCPTGSVRVRPILGEHDLIRIHVGHRGVPGQRDRVPVEIKIVGAA
jgi:hypothetical protein